MCMEWMDKGDIWVPQKILGIFYTVYIKILGIFYTVTVMGQHGKTQTA